MPCGRSARRPWCRLRRVGPALQATSAPRSPAPWFQRVLRDPRPPAPRRAESPIASALERRYGEGSTTSTSGAPGSAGKRAPSGGRPPRHRSRAHAGPPRRHPRSRTSRADQFGGRVQHTVGADRAHLRNVDAEHRIDVGRKGKKELLAGIGRVAGSCGRTSSRPDRARGAPCAGLRDAPDLHVPEERDRIPDARLAGQKQAVLRRPSARSDMGSCPLGR